MLFSLNFQIFGPFSFIRDTSPWITFNFQTPSEFFFCFSYNDHFEDAFKNFFSEALFFDLGMSVLRRSCYQLGRGARARSQAHKHKMRTKAVGHRHSQRGFVCFCYNTHFEYAFKDVFQRSGVFWSGDVCASQKLLSAWAGVRELALRHTSTKWEQRP